MELKSNLVCVSAKDLAKKLSQLGYPEFPVPQLTELWSLESDNMVAALQQIDSCGPLQASSREYVAAVLTCATHTCERVIVEHVGFNACSMQDLLAVSKAEGRSFRLAIKHISQFPEDASDEIRYLQRLILENSGLSLQNDPESLGSESSKATAPAKAQEKNHRPNTPPPPFKSLHVYAKNAALCICEDVTRRGSLPTLRFEVARASADGVYDWKDKESFQCSPGELVLIFGVFNRLLKKVELKGHGVRNEKSMSIELQGNKVYISLQFGKSRLYGIPFAASDTFAPTAMLFNRIKENAGCSEEATVLGFIRSTCELHASPPTN